MNIIQESPNGISFFNILEIIIGISIPLMVVLVSYLLQKCNELKKEKKRIRDIKHFIIYSLNSIKEPLISACKFLEYLSSSIKDPKQRAPIKPLFYRLHTSQIDSIISQDQYKSIYLISNKSLQQRKQNYSNFIDSVQFIKNIQREIDENFNNYFSDRRRYENTWNDSFKKVFELRNEFVSTNKSLNITPVSDSFVKSIDELTYKWPEIRDQGDIFNSHELFFIVLQQICKQYRDDPRIERFDRPLSDANWAIGNLMEINELYSKSYSDLSQNIKEIIDKIDSVIKFMK